MPCLNSHTEGFLEQRLTHLSEHLSGISHIISMINVILAKSLVSQTSLSFFLGKRGIILAFYRVVVKIRDTVNEMPSTHPNSCTVVIYSTIAFNYKTSNTSRFQKFLTQREVRIESGRLN